MLKKISGTFNAWAKGWLVIVLFVLDGFFVGLLLPVVEALLKSDSGGPGPIDLQFFYAPVKVFEMIAAYGPYGRPFYRNVELTVDIIYPIVYTLFLGLLISWLFQRGFQPGHKIQKWNVVPLGAWFFDLLENIGIVILISVFPATPAALTWITNFFSLSKWFFVFLSIGLVVVGLLNAARNKFRKQV